MADYLMRCFDCGGTNEPGRLLVRHKFGCPTDDPDVRKVRSLVAGDVVAARPCVVTIERVTTYQAYGSCSTCQDGHVIDLRRYEAGRGPWKPVTDGDSSPPRDGDRDGSNSVVFGSTEGAEVDR